MLLALLLLGAALPASSQAHYSAFGGGTRSGIYLLGTGGRPNYGADKVFGGTLGGFYQRHWLLGLDARLTDTKQAPDQVREYFYGVGPRVGIVFHRFSPFASLDAGLGHADYPAGWQANSVYHDQGGSTGFALMYTGGWTTGLPTGSLRAHRSTTDLFMC